MRVLTILVLMVAISPSSPALGAGPQLETEVASLAEQVASLRQQVAALQSLLAVDSSGNVVQRTALDKLERVGRDSTTEIGGDRRFVVQRSDHASIGTNAVLQVGGNLVQQVGTNATQQVGGSQSTTVARELRLRADEQLVLQSGMSQMVLRKDGTVRLTGVRIEINGSAEVALKAPKIAQN